MALIKVDDNGVSVIHTGLITAAIILIGLLFWDKLGLPDLPVRAKIFITILILSI